MTMRHLAQIDQAGSVLQVIVCDSIEWAQANIGGTWIETSIDGSDRARYAGIGYSYDSNLDAFLPPIPAFNYSIDGVSKNWIFPDGDHIYVPTAPDLVESLSRAIYKLIDPNRDGLYAGIVWHPSGNHWPLWPLLQLRSIDIVPISVSSDPSQLIAVLSAFVSGGALTQTELDGIVSSVTSMGGQSVSLIDLIPQSWRPYIMTKSQAVTAGYF